MIISFKLRPLLVITVWVFILILAGIAESEPCIIPDNGTGTATLPPMGCDYTSPDEVFMIIDGLPPGTTIEMEGILMNYICCDCIPDADLNRDGVVDFKDFAIMGMQWLTTRPEP